MATANDQWVVVSAGARDSYNIPIALHEAGLLRRLVTDFYLSLDRPSMAVATRMLPSGIRSKISRRFDPALPSAFVQSQLNYAIRNWWKPNDWMRRVGSLGERAGRIAAGERCSIFAYAHVATSAFAAGDVATKVLMQMQPHPAAVKAALLSDEFLPEFQDQIRNELDWPQDIFDTFSREPTLADLCIVASSYTRKTLMENGVRSDRISVVPYGVDLEFFCPATSQSDKLSVLFVGQLCRQKGSHYLLEAWRRLKLPNAELRVVGRFPTNSRILSAYKSYVRFLGPLDWKALREEHRRAHLLCLPSLSDGFGQVILEALACGTPALTTDSCGASDLIQHGENGFVIPAANLESLIASLEWASQNPEKLRQMRSPARATAEEYSWTKFRKNIVAKLQSLTAQS